MKKNILIAVDKFKGSISSKDIGNLLIDELSLCITKNDIYKIIVSDGGDGFLETINQFEKLKNISVSAQNPVNDYINTEYLFNPTTKSAFIETAKICGLSLLEPNQRNPLKTNTFGVGEVILDAIKNGAEQIYLGLGGSATNDCGTGMAQALGVKFLDENKNEIYPNGKNIGLINEIISSQSLKSINCKIYVLTDVDNPLTGENGCAKTFAIQKGASKEDVLFLENNMLKFSNLLKKYSNRNINKMRGSGAAGGLAAGLVGFLNAEIISGSDYIIEKLNIKNIIKNYDYIIVGEGKLDNQSLYGKIPIKIAQLAKKNNKKVFALCGVYEYDKDLENLFDYIYVLKKDNLTIDYCIKNVKNLIKEEVKFIVENINKKEI